MAQCAEPSRLVFTYNARCHWKPKVHRQPENKSLYQRIYSLVSKFIGKAIGETRLFWRENAPQSAIQRLRLGIKLPQEEEHMRQAGEKEKQRVAVDVKCENKASSKES